MKLRNLIIVFFVALIEPLVFAQSFKEQYEQFKNNAQNSFSSFRDECNQEYSDFLRTSWEWFQGKAPLPLPEDKNPIPPKPYEEPIEDNPISVAPEEVPVVTPRPQPKPIEPIKEIPTRDEDYFTLKFYGQECKIRLPELAKLALNGCQPNSIASGWESLCNEGMNNAIRDCLETRIRYNLCDWAYLSLLDALTSQFCDDKNGATLLMAYLFCQSGYQMRLAIDGSQLYMLFGSQHHIFDKGYYVVDGQTFYPLGEPSNSIQICEAAFEGETPLSLLISVEQNLGNEQSEEKNISSKRYSEVKASSIVPQKLINFYNSYPTSAIGGNVLSRWAMYANTPLAQSTKEILYPSLKKPIEGDSILEAANKLLNWVQTGFEYEYDDKVWGHDRAFFAEETLYYPYCDCEDRSILYSRLVRDLLGLDVALIYYPGHLATAVKFECDVKGDAMIIGDKKYTVCDPTYIGAPVGAQMPGLEYDKAQAIVLSR